MTLRYLGSILTFWNFEQIELMPGTQRNNHQYIHTYITQKERKRRRKRKGKKNRNPSKCNEKQFVTESEQEKNKIGVCDIITAYSWISIGNANIIWHLNKDIESGKKKGDASKEWTVWLGSARVV